MQEYKKYINYIRTNILCVTDENNIRKMRNNEIWLKLIIIHI